MTPIEAALAALKCEDKYDMARARALITVYDQIWAAKWAEYEIMQVEGEFAFPLLDPDTEAQSKDFVEAGKVDVKVRHRRTGAVSVVEHKTTSDGVEPDSHYWDRLKMDTQVSKYYLSALAEHDGASVIYDVVSKPGQRPRQIPSRDPEGFKIVLDQAGQRVMTANGKKPRETPDEEKGWVLLTLPESAEEFEARLLVVLREAPSDYFAQREIVRTNQDVLEYMGDAWATAQEILYRRDHNVWPRNPDACNALGTCEFLDLCAGRASVDSIRYRVRSGGAHPELVGQSGPGGEQLLTASRTKALHRCARYHRLKYEDHVEITSAPSEALAFGTLMHKAWEAYFACLKLLS